MLKELNSIAAGMLGLNGYPQQPLFGTPVRQKEAGATPRRVAAPMPQACPRGLAGAAPAAPGCR